MQWLNWAKKYFDVEKHDQFLLKNANFVLSLEDFYDSNTNWTQIASTLTTFSFTENNLLPQI